MSDASLEAKSPTEPKVSITLCANGPLLVRGDFEIKDVHGNPVDARRGTVALCRCGGSAIKPFCDGTHKVNGFCDDSSDARL